MSKENCRIWIVDDNEEFLSDLAFALRLEGWNVSSYDDPIKFLEELNFDSPGCIILDVRMPLLSGDEVQEHLLSKNCPLPVIFLTGHGDLNLAIHTFRRGAFDFIQKPFDPDYLLATIEKAVTTREPGFNEWKTEGPKEKFEKLTYRQKQVLTDISKGVPSRFIADHLSLNRFVWTMALLTRIRTVTQIVQSSLKIRFSEPPRVTTLKWLRSLVKRHIQV